MMTFDKNTFKDAFRTWVQSHPTANDEEALAFCQTHIPASQIMSHYWLVEQSLQWFTWLRSRGAFDHEDFQDGGALDEGGSRTLN